MAAPPRPRAKSAGMFSLLNRLNKMLTGGATMAQYEVALALATRIPIGMNAARVADWRMQPGIDPGSREEIAGRSEKLTVGGGGSGNRKGVALARLFVMSGFRR